MTTIVLIGANEGILLRSIESRLKEDGFVPEFVGNEVGALALGEDAQAMEDAGKAEDLAYISAHHARLMEEFGRYQARLGMLWEEEEKETDDRPEASETLLKKIYRDLIAAGEDMDCDFIEETFEALKNYRIPEADSDRIAAARECYDNFDYEGMANALR